MINRRLLQAMLAAAVFAGSVNIVSAAAAPAKATGRSWSVGKIAKTALDLLLLATARAYGADGVQAIMTEDCQCAVPQHPTAEALRACDEWYKECTAMHGKLVLDEDIKAWLIDQRTRTYDSCLLQSIVAIELLNWKPGYQERCQEQDFAWIDERAQKMQQERNAERSK